MHIAVAKESLDGERRVALTPDVVRRLIAEGHTVSVASDAGAQAGAPNAHYEKVGATISDDASNADVVVRVNPPTVDEVRALPEGCVHVSLLDSRRRHDVVRAMQARNVTGFALELVPRITRAQAMDVLSSMSTVAGYRAALITAQHLGKFFPMLMTAAGTIPPARVVVAGAGVAGLQAIATCRRLGAIVEAYDIRAEAREQAESLGANPIEVDLGESGEGEGGYAKELSKDALAKLEAALAKHVAKADACITTALIPGRPAPRLVDAATVEAMRPGAVIVDLAAETGGNCELTEAGKTVERHGVTIVGTLNLAATMPIDASTMFAKNVHEVIRHLTPKPAEGEDTPSGVHLDFDDEITQGSVAVHDGEVRDPKTKDAMEGSA